MIVNEDVIFNIIKASLWSQECGELVFTDDIKKELRKQSIDGLAAAVNPKSVNEKYYRAARFAQMLSVQSNVINCIQQAGIPVVVIKGTASGVYYPSPYLRKYGDIDILVHPDNYYKAVETLKNNGYKQDGDLGIDVTAFNKTEVVIELHQRPPGLNRVKEGSYIHSYLLSGLDNIEYASLVQPKMTFPMLPWKQNGLELIWHIREHLYNGLGLRQIIDWMMFVHQHLYSEERYKGYSVILKNAGLEKLALIVTRMCQLYLGLDDNITWCKNADDLVAGELMEYILDQGNFGIKREDDKTVKALTRYRNPISLMAAMQRKGLREWMPVKNHLLLRPFAWIYICIKGVCQYIGQGGRQQFFSDLKENSRRKKLFDRLYDDELEGTLMLSQSTDQYKIETKTR